jgi:hypothetical protein
LTSARTPLGAYGGPVERGPRQQGGELLAPITIGTVALADSAAQRGCHLAERFVALQVAVGGVVVVEVVDVDQQD